MSAGVRAATMTFVVYYDEPAIAGWLRERIAQIGEKHPSRVIILDGCTQPQPVTPPTVSTERIETGVLGLDAVHVDGQVAALQLADAPLVLAWIAHLRGDDRFTAIARRATTAIVSTSALGTGDEALRDLVAFAREHPDRPVHDIAYLRLATWQETIAEFFDTDHVLEELHNLRSVEVVAGSDAEALYLIGWLASRLQWKPCAHDRFCNTFDESIVVTIRREGAPRRISRVCLQSPATTFTAEVHADDESAILTHVRGKHERDARSVPVTKVDIASLVERAVLHPAGDALFQQTLPMVEQLLAFREAQ